MITKTQYFRNKPHTIKQEAAGDMMLGRVNLFLYHKAQKGQYHYPVDPDTDTTISGKKNGTGGGGFRLPDEEGAELSSHKEAKGVDVFDPDDELDDNTTDEELAEHGLYREHPSKTPGWMHLTDRPPNSGKRTFYP